MLYTQYLREQYKPMSRALVNKALRGEIILPRVPTIPPPLVHNTTGRYGVAITAQRSKTMEPAFVCISLVPKKVCMRQGCCKRPNPNDPDDQFKKCSRCHDKGMANVWYCTRECQLLDYPRHRPACKSDPLCPVEQHLLGPELDEFEHLTLVDTATPAHVYSSAASQLEDSE
jgi:hypothetical protein